MWIPDDRRYTYPDVFVIQGEPQFHENRSDTVTNPALIIEVLSPSISDYDRGEKFKAYRATFLLSYDQYSGRQPHSFRYT